MSITKNMTCTACGGQMDITGLDEEGRLVYECPICSYQEQSDPIDMEKMGLASNSHSHEELLLAIAYAEPIWQLDIDGQAADILIGSREEIAAMILQKHAEADDAQAIDTASGLPAGYRITEVDWIYSQ